MLEMIHGSREAMQKYRPPVTEKEIVSMKDAAWPSPFRPGLEYNSPAHGTWNIVHTGMLIPGSHQIYVCAANCNRGVVLTAAEMGAAGPVFDHRGQRGRYYQRTDGRAGH